MFRNLNTIASNPFPYIAGFLSITIAAVSIVTVLFAVLVYSPAAARRAETETMLRYSGVSENPLLHEVLEASKYGSAGNKIASATSLYSILEPITDKNKIIGHHWHEIQDDERMILIIDAISYVDGSGLSFAVIWDGSSYTSFFGFPTHTQYDFVIVDGMLEMTTDSSTYIITIYSDHDPRIIAVK